MLRRSIQAGTTNALPDPGYVNNPPADIGKVLIFAVTGAGADSGNSIYGTDIYTTGSHLGDTTSVVPLKPAVAKA